MFRALVSGTYFPPLRLDLIKHLPHPNHSSECLDPDCHVHDCKGNRFVVEDDPTSEPIWHLGGKRIMLHVVHGKNDKRIVKASHDISFFIPHGDFFKLLMAHIMFGHDVISMGMPIEELFFSCGMMRFSNATFTQYWEKLMGWDGSTFGLSYFPPSFARKIFIEDYMATHGAEPDMLDGAAAVMGNTVKQWKASYMPQRRKRLASMAVVARHAEIVAHAIDVGGGVDGEVAE